MSESDKTVYVIAFEIKTILFSLCLVSKAEEPEFFNLSDAIYKLNNLNSVYPVFYRGT